MRRAATCASIGRRRDAARASSESASWRREFEIAARSLPFHSESEAVLAADTSAREGLSPVFARELVVLRFDVRGVLATRRPLADARAPGSPLSPPELGVL